MLGKSYKTDLIIIGAGPVGLFSIFQAGMLKMSCHVIDTLEFVGGQCTALYPEKPIYDIPAHPKILASDLIANLQKQAEPFSPFYHLGQRVEKLKKLPNGNFLANTSLNNEIEAKAVIIASGCGAFGPNRPPIVDIEKYEGKSVFYSVNSRENFRNKRIVIAGGGDSAVDWALSLYEIAKKIYLVHRRDKFRCAPENSDKLKKLAADNKIELVVPYQLDNLKGHNGKLSEVIVKDFNGNLKEIEADILLAFYGLSMELGPIANWGLNLNKNLITVNPTTMETSEPRIYSVGDIATYQNKLKLILSGFAESASACHNIYHIVHPETPFHFEYSTNKGIKTNKKSDKN